jgi:GTPase SAR1 family protein
MSDSAEDAVKKYDGYLEIGDNLICSSKRKFKSKAYPGMYMLKMTDNGDPILVLKQNNHDDLVHLPDTAYEEVVNEINKFLKEETKKSYSDNGFLYKRSILLHGEAGVGKSCLVNRVTHDVIDKGGIVIFNPNPQLLSHVYEALDEIEGPRLVMVILEELDQLVEDYEDSLLHLLDGEIQRENVIYVATTNYLDKIPKRILRPGRFSLTLEVKHPSEKTREFYLKKKLSESDDIKTWVDLSEGFTIDELKETVLSVKCLDYPLDKAIAKIKGTKVDKSGISLGREIGPYDNPSDSFQSVSAIDREVNKIKNDIKRKQKRAGYTLTPPNVKSDKF